MIYRRHFAKPNLGNNLRNILSDLTSEEWDPVSHTYWACLGGCSYMRLTCDSGKQIALPGVGGPHPISQGLNGKQI